MEKYLRYFKSGKINFIWRGAILATTFLVALFISPGLVFAQVPWVGPSANPPDGNPPGFLLNTSAFQDIDLNVKSLRANTLTVPAILSVSSGQVNITGQLQVLNNNIILNNGSLDLISGSDICFNGATCIDEWSDLNDLGVGGSDLWSASSNPFIYNKLSGYDGGSGSQPHVRIYNATGSLQSRTGNNWGELITYSGAVDGATTNIQFGQDPGEKLKVSFSPGPNQSTNIMYFHFDGNVSIGTSAATARLDVYKTGYGSSPLFKIRNDQGQELVSDFVDAANAYVGTPGAYNLQLRTSNVPRVTLLSGGNVGIGISAPVQALDVAGSVGLNNNNIYDVNILSGRAIASYDKLRVWSSGSYSIGMMSAMTFGALNDYAMTFTMNNDFDRGFIWRDDVDAKSDGAMSLTTGGILTVKDRVGVGIAPNDIVVGTEIAKPKLVIDQNNRGSVFFPNDYYQGIHVLNAGNGWGVVVNGNVDPTLNGFGIKTQGRNVAFRAEGPIFLLGAVTIADGTQGPGEVLTSDANGLATWQPLPPGGVTGSGTVNYVAKFISPTAVGNSAIFDNGNVGIGTINPVNKLEVNVGNDGQLKLSNPTYNTSFGILQWSGITYLSSGVYYDNGSWVHNHNNTYNQLLGLQPSVGAKWWTSNNSSASWNVANNITLWNIYGDWTSLITSTRAGNSYITGGNVGIGTNAPTYKLDVLGSVRLNTGSAAPNYVLTSLDSSGNTQWKDVNTLISNSDLWSVSSFGFIYNNLSGYDGVNGDQPHVRIYNANDGSIQSRTLNNWIELKTYLGASDGAKTNIQFGQDPGEKLKVSFSPGPNQSTNIMYFHFDGNVSIGTSAATARLDVYKIGYGSSPLFKIRNDQGQELVSDFVDAANAYVGTPGAYNLQLRTSNIPRVTILSGGNVGIGTNAPTTELDVFSSSQTVKLALRAPDTSQSGIDFYDSDASAAFTIYRPQNSRDLAFWSSPVGGGGSRVMTITNSGNVGIGISNPGSNRLQVAGPVFIDGPLTLWPNNTLQSYGSLIFNTDLDGESIDSFIFQDAGVERVRIDGNTGNLGIGTNNPTTELDVYSGSQTVKLALRAPDTSQSGIDFYDSDAAAAFTIYRPQNSRDLAFWSNPVGGGGSRVMTITNDGNVGVGINPPTQKLDVVGNVKATGFCIGADCIASWPQGGTNLWQQTGSNIYYNTGLVGIGTNSPLTELDVYSGSQTVKLALRAPNASQSGIDFYDSDSVAAFTIYRPQNSRDLAFWASPVGGGGSRVMTITNSGNVGIGIDPSYKLDVTGTANLNSGVAAGVALRVNGIEALWYDSTLQQFSWGYGGTQNYFADPIGIGTNDPITELDVFSGSQTVKLALRAPNASQSGIDFYDSDASAAFTIYRPPNTRDLAFWSSPVGGGGSRVMTITNDGNVGVGINPPTASLDVTRGTGTGGTASFRGTDYTSHFNYSTAENTYIRGGKPNSTVYLNDGDDGGWVVVGSTAKTAATASNNSVLQILTGDTLWSGLEARGNSQGTGYLFVGQSGLYGGGMFYNGDLATGPSFASGEVGDRVSFYRMSNGVRSTVFSYWQGGDVVNFKESINLNENNPSGTAIEVNGDEALYYDNGAGLFSWGYGGTQNYFADNVGIKDDSPDDALDVTGNFRLSGTFRFSDGTTRPDFIWAHFWNCGGGSNSVECGSCSGSCNNTTGIKDSYLEYDWPIYDYLVMTCPSGYNIISGGGNCSSTENSFPASEASWHVSCGDQINAIDNAYALCAKFN